jgi:hypothetical protein
MILYLFGCALALVLILWLVGGVSGFLIAATHKEEPWTARQWRNAVVMAFIWPILIAWGFIAGKK